MKREKYTFIALTLNFLLMTPLAFADQGIDDDSNSYQDDTRGWNLVESPDEKILGTWKSQGMVCVPPLIDDNGEFRQEIQVHDLQVHDVEKDGSTTMTFASDGTFNVVEILPGERGGCKGTSEGAYSTKELFNSYVSKTGVVYIQRESMLNRKFLSFNTDDNCHESFYRESGLSPEEVSEKVKEIHEWLDGKINTDQTYHYFILNENSLYKRAIVEWVEILSDLCEPNEELYSLYKRI